MKRAFGLVVHEMIRLQRLFNGNDVFTVIGAIVRFENINLNEIESEMFKEILKKFYFLFYSILK